MEIWKDIEQYKGVYQVSSEGRVKRLDTTIKSNEAIQPKRKWKGRILKNDTTPRGYKTVELSMNGFRKRHQIHRLVAEAFIPNPKEKPQVNHIDLNSSNNNVENLEWCTAKENTQHAIKHGARTSNVGEKHGMAKLNRANVACIRRMYRFDKKPTYKEVAEQYGVHPQTISDIINNRRWKNAA